MVLAVDEVVEAMRRFAPAGWIRDDWGGSNSWASLVSARQYGRLCGLMNRYVPAGTRVLDWGAGGGMWSFALLSVGYRVAAFDLVAPPLLDRLEAFGGGRYQFRLAEDPVNLPFEEGAFDAVTSVGVLEHVRETGGTERLSLDEVVRVLRPGGHFVCYHFPNRWSWIDAAARRRPDAHHHDFRYVAADIERLARDADLELLTHRRYGALPRNSAARLPDRLSESPVFASIFDAVDRGAGVVARPICQNHLWVGRRPIDLR